MLGQRVSTALALLAVLAASTSAKSRPANYVHPHFADFHVQSIALMPVAVEHEAPRAPEILMPELEQRLAFLSYRWVSTSTLREALTSEQSTELDRLVDRLRRNGSLDASAVRSVGAHSTVDALLATLVTTWESATVPQNISGQSLTQIGLRTFLFSAKTGELLWSHGFLERGEGTYNNPGEEVNLVTPVKVGLPGGSAGPEPGKPPYYQAVAAKLAVRVRDAFPPPSKPAAP